MIFLFYSLHFYHRYLFSNHEASRKKIYVTLGLGNMLSGNALFYGLAELPYFIFPNSNTGRGTVFSQRFDVTQTIFVNTFNKQYCRQFCYDVSSLDCFLPGAMFRPKIARLSCWRYKKIILSRDNLTVREMFWRDFMEV